MLKQFLIYTFTALLPLFAEAQWEHIEGPEGGKVFDLEQDGQVLYALSRRGIYRSPDQGRHWELLEGSGMAGQLFTQIKAENGHFYGIETNTGILRHSIDGGKTWPTLLGLPLPRPATGASIVDILARNDTLLVAANDYLLYSHDRGVTWQVSQQHFVGNIFRLLQDGRNYFIWNGTYVWKSSDGGVQWEKIFSSFQIFRTVSVVDGRLFILYKDGRRLVRSEGSNQWKTFDVDLSQPDGCFTNPGQFMEIVGHGDTLFYIYASCDPEPFCESLVSYSTDKGASWRFLNGGNPLQTGITDWVAFPGRLVASHKAGVWASTDAGTSLKPSQTGIRAHLVSQIVARGSHLMISDGRNIFYSADGGKNWERPAVGVSWDQCIYGAGIAATSARWWLYFWYLVSPPLQSNDFGEHWYRPSFLGPGISTHCNWSMGDDWVLRRSCDADTALQSTDLRSLAADNYIDRIYDLPQGVLLELRDSQLVEVQENGEWRTLKGLFPGNISPFSNYFAYKHHLIGFNDEKVFVYRSDVAQWARIYPQNWLTGALIRNEDIRTQKLYRDTWWLAVAERGLLYAADATGRFYPFTPALPSDYPNAMAFDQDTLWVGAYDGTGLYRITLPPFQAASDPLPVFRAWPNPIRSNASGQLESSTFLGAYTPLTLYNALGQKVWETELAPGQSWHLTLPPLSPGWYVARLQLEGGRCAVVKWMVG